MTDRAAARRWPAPGRPAGGRGSRAATAPAAAPQGPAALACLALAWLALACLALACLALSGCGKAATARSGAAATGPAPGGTAATGAPGAAAATGPAPAGAAAPRFCPTAPGRALKADLSRTVPGSAQGEILPLGMSADGRTAYVSAWVPGYAGVAELSVASGRLRAIQPFASPGTDQADGASGGRWLVWEKTYSLQSLDDFTVYAWDSATGRVRWLGHSLPGPGGRAWPSPWHPPAVSGRYAAWAQGYGPGGLVEIRLADLQTGRVTVIRQGHVQPPFFDGSLLVWPESDRPGTQTSLHGYSLLTGRAAVLPPVLRAVHGTEFVATDGTRTAYFSPDLTRLYYSAVPGQPGQVVLRLPAGVDFSGLSVGTDSLAWTTSQATYLASTRTGAYAQVTPRYGFATGSGSDVAVSDAPSRQAAHPPLPMHVIGLAGITWPPCRG